MACHQVLSHHAARYSHSEFLPYIRSNTCYILSKILITKDSHCFRYLLTKLVNVERVRLLCGGLYRVIALRFVSSNGKSESTLLDTGAS